MRAFLVCVLAALGGCSMMSARLALDTPGSFRGVLPCDGCDGVDTTLTLREDGLYLLRERSVGTQPVHMAIELGRWRLADFNQRLVLEGATPRAFGIVSPSRLEVERGDAAAVPTLERLTQMDSIGGPFLVRGDYAYLADAARLTECGTGRSFAIAMAGDSRVLEGAYLATRVVSGEPMFVTFEGRLARVSRMDEEGEEDAFVVDRFERVWPSASCSTRLALPLVGTQWRLEELGGVASDVLDGAPELVFTEDGRLSGSNGCNRVSGTYTRHDDALSFGGIARTRKACEAPKVELEQRFGAMLGEVDGLRLERTRLVMLRGANVVSRFVAAE